jgi:hypothetical protein
MLRRRDAIFAALPTVASACSLGFSRNRGDSSTLRIVVVGGGLSGLAVAHGLSKLGREIIVLEADERPGGRILTLRKPCSNGLYVEAGAKHVVGDPDLLAFIRDMGVSLARVPSRPKLSDARVLNGPGGPFGPAIGGRAGGQLTEQVLPDARPPGPDPHGPGGLAVGSNQAAATSAGGAPSFAFSALRRATSSARISSAAWGFSTIHLQALSRPWAIRSPFQL